MNSCNICLHTALEDGLEFLELHLDRVAIRVDKVEAIVCRFYDDDNDS